MKILLKYWEKEGGPLRIRRASDPRRMGALLSTTKFYKANILVSYPELEKEYGEMPTNEGTYYTKKDLHLAFKAFTEEQ